jgi:hypothetical protein
LAARIVLGEVWGRWQLSTRTECRSRMKCRRVRRTHTTDHSAFGERQMTLTDFGLMQEWVRLVEVELIPMAEVTVYNYQTLKSADGCDRSSETE